MPWSQANDPTTGKPYYYHTETRETRWDRPPEMDACATTSLPEIHSDLASDQVQPWAAVSGPAELTVHWRDQGWGNQKGALYARSEGGWAVLASPAPHGLTALTVGVPRGTVELGYLVGGGGGHELHLQGGVAKPEAPGPIVATSNSYESVEAAGGPISVADWPGLVYLETGPLPGPLAEIQVSCSLRDQGFGGTGQCGAWLVLASADGVVKASSAACTVDRGTVGDGFREHRATIGADAHVAAHAAPGDTLMLCIRSAPWPAWECHCNQASLTAIPGTGQPLSDLDRDLERIKLERLPQKQPQIKRSNSDTYDLQQLAMRPAGEVGIPVERIDQARAETWDQYQQSFCSEGDAELQCQTIADAMRIVLKENGDSPPNGWPLYICLHGGGGCPPSVNDSQWEHMKSYYFSTLQASGLPGLYVAPRGITDTWNLHFTGGSYKCYDKLIADLLCCGSVDPNRVYLLGFSAGGDGVYQAGPRMADRWAACNMSSGHPNGIPMRSLFNTPFLIQVGENDTAYNRHSVGAQYGVTLDGLTESHGGYISECFVHCGRGHNYPDNDFRQQSYTVYANPRGWLDKSDCSTRDVNTNAVAWVALA